MNAVKFAKMDGERRTGVTRDFVDFVRDRRAR
jgi:hypothetical protein